MAAVFITHLLGTLASCSGLSITPPNVLAMMNGPPFYLSSSGCYSRVMLLLLILAGVESNPGPQRSFRLGVLNTGGASWKAAGLSDIITDNRLDAVAICETWIMDTAPDTIKLGLSPPAFTILHIYQLIEPGGPTRGGGLAYIIRNNFC